MNSDANLLFNYSTAYSSSTELYVPFWRGGVTFALCMGYCLTTMWHIHRSQDIWLACAAPEAQEIRTEWAETLYEQFHLLMLKPNKSLQSLFLLILHLQAKYFKLDQLFQASCSLAQKQPNQRKVCWCVAECAAIVQLNWQRLLCKLTEELEIVTLGFCNLSGPSNSLSIRQ